MVEEEEEVFITSDTWRRRKAKQVEEEYHNSLSSASCLKRWDSNHLFCPCSVSYHSMLLTWHGSRLKERRSRDHDGGKKRRAIMTEEADEDTRRGA